MITNLAPAIFAVATNAKIVRQARQQMFHVGGMRIVAVHTFGPAGQRIVLHLGVAHQIADGRMATQTQCFGFLDQ